jgi:hypothetical protein
MVEGREWSLTFLKIESVRTWRSLRMLIERKVQNCDLKLLNFNQLVHHTLQLSQFSKLTILSRVLSTIIAYKLCYLLGPT